MEKIATDIYTFSNLRGNGYMYVDKTDRILQLVNDTQGRQFFLARPRRFGKSLLVSTLKALFQGKRELFVGLAIEPQWDWSKAYPVLHLDMGSTHADTVEGFWANINNMVNIQARENGVAIDGDGPADVRFENLCHACAAKSPTGQIVILIDEYDKPLLGHLGEPAVEAFRAALKSFYSVIKTCEGLQRFALITGVSKFSKASIFVDAAFAGIVRWYDGYLFHPQAEKVFNPVSLGRCFAEPEFKAYWYEMGTPTFLVKMLRAPTWGISPTRRSRGRRSTATAPSALALIVRNRCHEKFLSEGKRATLVGINFSTRKRGVASWRSKVITPA